MLTVNNHPLEKVLKACKIYNNTSPIFTWGNSLNVEFISQYPKKVGENLTDNQNKILKQMQLNSKISAKDLALLVGISSRKIEENIKKLKDQNIIIRIGGAKGVYWEIQNNATK